MTSTYVAQRVNRRELMAGVVKTAIASSVLPALGAAATAPRCINIVNFIRAEEPRQACDLFRPVQEQMALIRKHQLPATWLLQYDALVEGPFVDFLKRTMPADHEAGIWFEMNRKICDDAGVAWRGRPDWEWDYHVPVAYSIGYTPAERRKLADTAMTTFRRIFGRDAKSIASWNLDAISLAQFAEQHHADAFGNCRDQLATDGFTIWGSPIAGYYPCRRNAWSPAVDKANQIATPMFRLLGQDPVYYYDKKFPYPDTLEPVWPSGRSEVFVDRFFDMIAHRPTGLFGYAQLGQENSFGWPEMEKAYPMQMEKLAALRKTGGVIVETMGDTGRRFKRSFASTPAHAQVMLDDPFGDTAAPERSAWYQSRYYRANLHFRKDLFFLRDLHVYNDRFPQPFLEDVVREHGIEQRGLAALDGFHWTSDAVRAMGRFVLVTADGHESQLAMSGVPTAREDGAVLRVTVPLASGGSVEAIFDEREIRLRLRGVKAGAKLAIVFEWDASLSALREVAGDRLAYRFRDFDYSVRIAGGTAAKTATGAKLTAAGADGLRLLMPQTA